MADERIPLTITLVLDDANNATYIAETDVPPDADMAITRRAATLDAAVAAVETEAKAVKGRR